MICLTILMRILTACKQSLFTTEIETPSTRFNVLDGFRGIMAISVVLQHTVKIFKMKEEYSIFRSLGSYFGVPSFFILSSFLLTNKLFELMIKSNGDCNQIKQIIVKYIIRRFFRIYIPYFLYCVFVSMELTISTKYGYTYSSFYSLVTLQKSGANHIWTVLPEIKYYFFIPIFTFITFKFQKFFFLWISFLVIGLFCIEKFNIFGMKCFHVPWPTGQNLLNVFQIF